MRRYGIGWLTAVAIWAEFGDVRRFAGARQAVRFTGLDTTISESDGKRARGHLARQGSPVLRWALHEAAMRASRPGSPDHAYYPAVKQRLGGKRAALSVARKLAHQPYHTCATSATRRLLPSRCAPGGRLTVPGHRRLQAMSQLMWCIRLPDAPVATLVVTTAIQRAAAPATCGNPITHHVAGPHVRAPR